MSSKFAVLTPRWLSRGDICVNMHPSTRRLIGRPFDDPIVKKDIESWPFKVVEQGSNPMVQVEYLGETKTFSPQEISAMVLTKVNNTPVIKKIRAANFSDTRHR